MGGAEIARDAIRIATTAGLSKDVIDLLEKKISLLTEQIATLETENANLTKKVVNLEQEVDRTRPNQSGLDETARKFIKVLFERGSSMDFDHVAAILGVTKGKAAYYIDVLTKHGMIVGTGVVLDDALGAYELTPQGREFAVTSGLA
jgi:FtsZ-binding cell division protein ZapB